ncbi:MAG: Hsp20/alpha crystallin family protein [Candidatus Yanofskybacteria bacterium]|nr:Hsp20/alpha crystallin family protein [Candidatus Yanofskybacteria bacterium]
MADFFEEQFGVEADHSELGDADLAVSKSPARVKQAEEEGQLTVDVYQTEDEIIIKSTIAGVTADDIDISITNDMVIIKGTRKSDEKVKTSDYYYQELYWGQFSRSIILPEEIDANNSKATMKNGILTLKLPKLAKSKAKK